MIKFNFKLDRQLATVAFYILAGLLITLGLYFFLIVRTTSDINDYKKRVEIATGESKRKRVMLQEINDFDKTKLDIESKILKFSSHIPYKLDTTDFVKSLDRFSSEFDPQSGLRDIRVDILPLMKIKEGYYQRQFRIYCQGRYMDLMKFLDALQSTKYLINIEELNVKRNAQLIPYLELDLRISVAQTSEEE
jgi:Tfp pilus assembly protein PilO